MCIIVDANLSGDVFKQDPPEAYRPIIDWLKGPKGHLVYGGKLAHELQKREDTNRYLKGLLQAGRASLISDDRLNIEQEQLASSGLLRSDDPHVIALARVSGARTLCSQDKLLARDFTNQRLIAQPRGKVYKRAEHEHLLRHTSSCGHGRR